MIKLGSHMFFKKPDYLLSSAKQSLENGANCMMIYLGPPQSTYREDISNFKLEEFKKEYSSKMPLENIVVHAPYIINLANPEKEKFSKNFLIKEITNTHKLGFKYIVLHPGFHTKYSPKEALDTLIKNLKDVLEKTNDVTICIETMAGKGSEIGKNIEELKYILENVNSERIGLCLDTCHIWDAGYNIKDYETFKKILKENNLLNKIKVIHLNDSLNDLNAKKDRHANINKGKIGLETLQKFVFDKDFDNIPIILETPLINDYSDYSKEIKMLLNK